MWKYNPITGKWEYIPNDPSSKAYNKELTNQPVINDDSNLLDTMSRVFERKRLLSDPNIDQETRQQLEDEQLFSPYEYQTEESNREALIKGDPQNEQYFKYLKKAENRFDKAFLTTEDPYKAIALDQGIGEQFGRKVGNLLPNIALGIVESIGYLGELPGAIIGNDQDFSNSLTEWAKAGKDDIFGETYRMNPNKVIDLSDSGWWMNNGFDLIESIGEFALTGAGIGSALGKVSKGLSTAMKLGQTGSKILNIGLANVPTSAALAYTEGAMSGSEIYKQVYEDVLRRTGNEQYANEQASNSAATTVGLNTAINTALNLYSVGAMFTNPSTIASATKRLGMKALPGESGGEFAARIGAMGTEYIPSKMRSLLKYMKEAPLEATEELVNVFAEKRGRVKGGLEDSKGWVDDLYEALKSDEGLLSMTLGALGGIGNIAIMNNLPSISRSEDTRTGFKLGESARQKRLNENKTIYAAQINSLKQDLLEFVENKDKAESLANEGKYDEAKYYRNKLFNIGTNRAIIEGNADSLMATLQEVASVDNETIGEDGKTDAMRQGLAKDTLDNNYKTEANKKIEKVRKLHEDFGTIENNNFQRELVAPGYTKHLFSSYLEYDLARDNFKEALQSEGLANLYYNSMKKDLIDLVPIVSPEDADNPVKVKEYLENIASIDSKLKDTPEFKDLDNKRKLTKKAKKLLEDANDKYKSAQDFEAYKKSLEKTVEDIDTSIGKNKGEQVLSEVAKQDLDTKLANAGYQRTGKVGEYFVFNKEGKNFIAERVLSGNKQRVQIKDPTTGKYLVDSKGNAEEFTLDYYSKNKGITIIPKQQFLDERKAEILSRSKDAQNAAIESVINDYRDKLKRINDSIPEYEQMIVDLSLQLHSLEKDMTKILQKNRTSKLSKKDIKDRVKSIEKVITETEDKLSNAREAKINIERSITVLQDFQSQLKLIPKDQMISISDILKDTQFVMENYPIEETENKLKDIVQTLEDIILNLNAEKDRLQYVVDSLNDLLQTDELYSALVSKNIRVATFLDKYPDFPARLLQDTTKLLDSDLNKLAVRNYLKRLAAGQNLPWKQVKQQMIDTLYPIAYAELLAADRQKIDNDLNVALVDLKEAVDKLNTYLKQQDEAKQKLKDIYDLKNQFDILDKHITILANRYSKELAKSEKEDGENVDKSQLSGIKAEITEGSEVDELKARDTFLSNYVFYTTGRNVKFDKDGTVYDMDGNPVFEEGYQQRWFKFLDKHSREIEPTEDEPSEFALKVFVRNGKGTPTELNKLMNEEVGDKVAKDSIDLGVFLVDGKGEYVRVDEKGDKDVNGIPVFTFLPRLNSLLPTDREPKVTWQALTDLYLGLHTGSVPTVKNQKDDKVVKFQGEDMTIGKVKEILVNEARTYYDAFINKIVNNDSPVQLEIGSITNGIALRKKDKEGNIRTQSLEQLLKSADAEIEAIHISKFGQATVVKGVPYQYDPGTVIVELDNGAAFPVHTITLNKDDVDTALYLIAQGKFSFTQEIPLGTYEKDGKTIEKFTTKGAKKVRIFPKNRSDKFSLLGNLINWGKYNTEAKNKNYEIFIDRGYVHFKDVANGFTPIRLALDEVTNDKRNGKLREFLAQKKYNVSSPAVNSNARYYHPIVKDGKIEFKEFKSYEDYLADKIKTFTFVSKDGQMMASKNIVIATDGKGFPIIKNVKIETTTKKTSIPEEPEIPGEDDIADELGMTATNADFDWENDPRFVDPDDAKNIRKEGKIISSKQNEIDKEADKTIEKAKGKVKRIGMKDSINDINNPVDDPYYGFGKEVWDAMSEEEKRTAKQQKDNCGPDSI